MNAHTPRFNSSGSWSGSLPRTSAVLFLGRKGLAFRCLSRLWALLPRDRSERRKQHKLFTVGFRAAALAGRFKSGAYLHSESKIHQPATLVPRRGLSACILRLQPAVRVVRRARRAWAFWQCWENKQQGFPFPQFVKERGVGSSSGRGIRSCEAHGPPLLVGSGN